MGTIASCTCCCFFPRAMAAAADDDDDDADADTHAATKNFRLHENFRKKVWLVAIDFVKKSLKSESSSRFLSCSKFGKLARHFLANPDDRPRINANLLTIRVNPGTIGEIRSKVDFPIFWVDYLMM